MKHFLTIIITFFSCSMIFSQSLSEIIDSYQDYKEYSIKNRRFKHSDIEPLIQELGKRADFLVKEEGKSIEGRNIYSLKWGNGPVNVLLWSQMHGNEPTATMALFDIFNFLTSEDHQELKAEWSEKLTITFIPMLNPDGAERFVRRNALGVDLNRDALRLQSPEARILKNKRDETNADFGFNLHDQGRVYSAGYNPHQATISFLSPAYNYEKETNEVRENAMKLISELTTTLNEYIPGKIGKYNDDFEPRAFGDNIQKWGTSLILIESGGYPGDREKQHIRKMNFVALMKSFESIASGNYANQPIDVYNELPFNARLYYDLLIKGVTIEKDGEKFVVDIAIDQDEVSTNGARDFYLRGTIQEIGDLSIYYGYKTLDATGMEASPGAKIRSNDLNNSTIFLKTGALFMEYAVMEELEKMPPINLVGSNGAPTMDFKIGNLANFVIRQDGAIKYLVINGYLVDPSHIETDVQGLDLR